MYLDLPPELDADALHLALYAGRIARFTALRPMGELVAFADGFLRERLAPHRPEEIHRHLDRERLAETLGEAQRAFSRQDGAKRLWLEVFEAAGLDPEDTARDRLILRFQPPIPEDGRPHRARSTGTVGFHRDTWGTNLYAQVNWWAPVYPITAGRTFAFFPDLFARPIPNSSASFDLSAAMDRGRQAPTAADRGEMVPRPTGTIDPGPALPVTISPGEVIAFSAQHAHEGVQNRTDLTRVSLETRTLRLSDLRAGRGAPNVDGRAPWMAPGMFRMASSGQPLTEMLGVERLAPFTGPWPPGGAA